MDHAIRFLFRAEDAPSGAAQVDLAQPDGSRSAS